MVKSNRIGQSNAAKRLFIDEGSTTIIPSVSAELSHGIVYSPLKYRETEGIKDLGYSKVKGRTMYADHKLEEFKERKSM